jgi:hypothetical protein
VAVRAVGLRIDSLVLNALHWIITPCGEGHLVGFEGLIVVQSDVEILAVDESNRRRDRTDVEKIGPLAAGSNMWASIPAACPSGSSRG